MAAAPAGLRRQRCADPGHHGGRPGQRRRRRSDAGDPAPGALPVSAAGTAQHRRHLGSDATDAIVRSGRGDAARRRQLLLARTRARSRTDRDPADGAVHLRRCRDQHARRRVLALRHLAHAQRASTTTHCRGSTWWPTPSAAPGFWQLVARARPHARASADWQATLRSTRPAARDRRSIYESENVPGGHDALGDARAYRLCAERGGPSIEARRPIQQRLLLFVRDWHGLWSAFGARPRRLAALSRAARCRTARPAGARSAREIVLSNTVGLMQALDAWVFNSRACGSPQQRGPGDPAEPFSGAVEVSAPAITAARSIRCSIARCSSSVRRARVPRCCSRRWRARRACSRSAMKVTS